MSTLANLVQDLATGGIKVIDLTETLREDYPVISYHLISSLRGRLRRRSCQSITTMAQCGSGTTYRSMSTPAPTLTPPSTGFRVKTYRITRLTQYQRETSLRLPVSWIAARR